MPFTPTAFYSVHLGHTPDRKPTGVHNDFERFYSKKKAEAKVVMSSGSGKPSSVIPHLSVQGWIRVQHRSSGLGSAQNHTVPGTTQ